MTSFTPALNEMGSRLKGFGKDIGHGWLLLAVVFAVQAAVDIGAVPDRIVAVGESFGSTLPFLLLAVAFAAYSKATGADALIARAFTGREAQMVLVAAMFGALSPFCSCGVIPIIAALLAMGVPLSAVMAFWLASPLMDPTMFAMTTGILGWEFAVAKTIAAAGIGMGGGYLTMALGRTGMLTNPLREGVGNGGCGASSVRNPNPQVHWKFWQEGPRRETFAKNAWSNLLFLGQWLALAFALEAVMIAYLPQESVAGVLGSDSWFAIPLAAVVGIPAYLNGYAALPLVSGLIDSGMSAGAGMAFLVAGGITCIPAGIAVWALARPPVFAIYIGSAFAGAIGFGLLAAAVL
jgi:uncharacterized membrane protein YraQ (UPF0718 family)